MRMACGHAFHQACSKWKLIALLVCPLLKAEVKKLARSWNIGLVSKGHSEEEEESHEHNCFNFEQNGIKPNSQSWELFVFLWNFCDTKSVYKLKVMCIKSDTNYTYSLQYKRSAGLYIIEF